MSAKLIVDLAECSLQEESSVQCSYSNHPDNKGFDSLLEMIRFALICRKCKSAPCITACPNDALEKVSKGDGDEGILKRFNMLCTGCGTCAVACPFGTIYTDLIPYPSSVCDVCRGRLVGDEKPLCVTTCEDGSIDYGEKADGKDMVEVFDDIVVKVADGILWEPFIKEKEKSKK
jgi:Fe-S-cluster-containing dehydrogenase component